MLRKGRIAGSNWILGPDYFSRKEKSEKEKDEMKKYFFQFGLVGKSKFLLLRPQLRTGPKNRVQSCEKDSVAQLVEHYTFNVVVLGSNPSGITDCSLKSL